MTQSYIKAGNPTNPGIDWAGGDDGALKLMVGPESALVNAMDISPAGVITFKSPFKVTDAPSMIRVNTANGYGSTATAIRRFSNVVVNQGSDITYTDSPTAGASFTINTAGVYAISYCDQFASANTAGLSLNDTNLTGDISASAVGAILAANTVNAASHAANPVWSGFLPAGSIIRANSAGLASGGNVKFCQFTIVKTT